MGWLSILTSTFSYLLLPLSLLLRVLLIVLAPLIYLGSYVVAGTLVPFKILAKFETLYIYIGAAAIVGLITGSIIHLSSSVLISIFNLTPAPEDRGRTAASVRAARDQKKLEGAWEASLSKEGGERWRGDHAILKKPAAWSDTALRTRGDKGLLGQTIIEEDDDSEDGF
ncbi:hypothetical protein G7Y89_g15296 [Cudoniella acicularis]|uniref:Uncharacterized protein n=1 Tax=Cudoniella acicularis TaxID=354080 RepID=A0A8H4QR11_9HELO|nr:hypothetical protein G7Y89_g15296 [Cudoniella acicularis]